MQTSSELTADLLDVMGGDDSIVRAMLVSTQGAASLDATASAGRIGAMMRNKHGSPFEHNSMTFFVRAPIMVFREFHRHRIGFSYNEMSGRYKELPDNYYLPPRHRPLIQTGKAIDYQMGPETDDAMFDATIEDLTAAYEYAHGTYQRILARGHAKEIARACLPVGIYTEMYATCNARSLMAFLSLRTHEPTATFPSKPQWEIEQVARQMEVAFAEQFPITYEAFNGHGRVAP
jgi:thymidylate synthase (FAD)